METAWKQTVNRKKASANNTDTLLRGLRLYRTDKSKSVRFYYQVPLQGTAGGPMLTIQDNGLQIDDGQFRYAWYRVSESTPQGHEGGTPYYRCVALKAAGHHPGHRARRLQPAWQDVGRHARHLQRRCQLRGRQCRDLLPGTHRPGAVFRGRRGRPGRKHRRRECPAGHGHRRRGHGELPPIPARPPQRGLAALVSGFHHLARPLHRRHPRTPGPTRRHAAPA